jgi:ubiquitin-protein ligase
MDNVRLRRLKADYEAIRRLANLHPRIEIEGVSGNPPDRYRLVLRVKSLRERGESIEPVDEHRLEITMPRGYPRDAPMFRMLTPVFHPNIAPHAVCIGDNWTAGESLDLLIQRVGEILAYQSYNTKSPLNGRAAQWVDENRERVPVDRDEFFVDLSAVPAPTPAHAAQACSNCGSGGPLTPCMASHTLCGDCVMRCPACTRVICLSCDERSCTACAAAG